MFDDFTNNWTGDSTIDLTNVLTGSKSLKVVANSGVNSSIQKSLNYSFEGKDRQVMIKFYTDEPSSLQDVILYMSNDESLNNHASYKFSKIKNGWNYMLAVTSQMTYVGNFSWSEPIKKIKIEVIPKTGASVTVTLDSLWNNSVGIPKILFTFDDGWKTVYDNAFPLMQERGIRGTTYSIPGYSSNPNSPLYPDVCKSHEFMEMYEAGWTIGNHTWGHDYYLTGPYKGDLDAYKTRIRLARNWLRDQGFGDDSNYLCFPNGERDDLITQELPSLGVKTARPGGRPGIQPHHVDSFLHTFTALNFTTNVTVEQAKKAIDRALESGGTTYFMFHQIPLDDRTSNGNENPYISWSKWKLEELLDYVVERGAVDYCVNNREWYYGYENPRFSEKRINRISI